MSAAPHAEAPQEAPEFSTPVLLTPSLRRRMACWLYEGMLLFGVVFIADYLLSALSQTKDARDNRLLQQFFLFVVLGIYFSWFWSKGQTLAMKTWHIRVVDRYGKALTQKRAFVRYVLSWLWFVPPLAALSPFKVNAASIMVLLFGWIAVWAILSRFHPSKQFWHDVWAGTRLIDVRPRA